MLHAIDKRAFDRFQFDLAGASDIGKPLKHDGERDLGLNAREWCADAEVNAVPEGDMAVWRSADIENVGMGELCLVAVSRAETGHDNLARLNSLIADLCIF